MVKTGLQIETKAKWVADEDPDLSWLEQNYACKPGCGHDPKSDQHVSKELNAEYQAKDAQRLAAYNRGEWWMEGCVVTAYLLGKEIGQASLWGIESDREASYTAEVEANLTQEAIAEAKAWLQQVKEG